MLRGGFALRDCDALRSWEMRLRRLECSRLLSYQLGLQGGLGGSGVLFLVASHYVIHDAIVGDASSRTRVKSVASLSTRFTRGDGGLEDAVRCGFAWRDAMVGNASSWSRVQLAAFLSRQVNGVGGRVWGVVAWHCAIRYGDGGCVFAKSNTVGCFRVKSGYN